MGKFTVCATPARAVVHRSWDAVRLWADQRRSTRRWSRTQPI